jgi:hypothetical protein
MFISIALLAAATTPVQASTDDCLYALEYAWAAQSSVSYAQTLCGGPALDRTYDLLGVAINQLDLASTDAAALSRAETILDRSDSMLDRVASNPFVSDACIDAVVEAQTNIALALEYADLCDPSGERFCESTGATNTCTVYLDRGSVVCEGSDAPAAVTSTDSGMVLSLDMTAYEAVRVETAVFDPSEWALHLSNSATSDGWCGDSGSTDNDSEAWLYSTAVQVCSSDRGGSSYPIDDGGVVDPAGDSLTFEACDGEFHYASGSGASNSAYSDYIFQIDGDEPDTSGTLNDQNLYLGIGRVVSGTHRLGVGVDGDTVAITFFAR